MQRHFGALRRINPVDRLVAGREVCTRIRRNRQSPKGKVFFEVGTGRRINMPIAFWLLGSRKVITVDLNPYLKEELIREDIEFIRTNQKAIKELFKDHDLVEGRLSDLIDRTADRWSLEDLLALCNVEYISPGDATNLPIETASVDYHTSYTTLEHIPPATIVMILKEGSRVVKEGGLLVHRIDYTDHFAHSDRSISAINFLQFDQEQWDRIAGNRYMYMNRLRVDDVEALYQEANQRIVSNEPDRDPSLSQLLNGHSFVLDEAFGNKSEEVLVTTGSWIVSEKRRLR
jgi:SAM-dependent methyltransferase